jgi:hypothetical protein
MVASNDRGSEKGVDDTLSWPASLLIAIIGAVGTWINAQRFWRGFFQAADGGSRVCAEFSVNSTQYVSQAQNDNASNSYKDPKRIARPGLDIIPNTIFDGSVQ